MRLVKINSTFLKNGYRYIKSLVRGRSDVQSSKQILPFGIDSNPVKDMVAVYSPTGIDGETVIVGYIQKNVIAGVGETHIFSTDENGNEQIRFKLLTDGNAELGGNADNLVRYSKLEEAFNQLKDDFNDLVNKFNSHIHVTTATIGSSATPGVIAPTTNTDTPSTADISPAKIDELKSS